MNQSHVSGLTASFFYSVRCLLNEVDRQTPARAPSRRPLPLQPDHEPQLPSIPPRGPERPQVAEYEINIHDKPRKPRSYFMRSTLAERQHWETYQCECVAIIIERVREELLRDEDLTVTPIWWDQNLIGHLFHHVKDGSISCFFQCVHVLWSQDMEQMFKCSGIFMFRANRQHHDTFSQYELVINEFIDKFILKASILIMSIGL